MRLDSSRNWYEDNGGGGPVSPYEEWRIRRIASLADMEAFAELPEPPAASDVIFRATPVPKAAAVRGIGGYVAALATGIAAATGAFWLAERAWDSPVPVSTLAIEELVTGAGESNTVVLSDGSLVRVGPGSRIRVGTGTPDRQVTLEGRAFFVVESDPERPFRVVTPGGGVRALGTRFQVDADASDVRVVVVDGRVVVDGVGEQVELGAGQMVRRQGTTLGAVENGPTLSELSEGWLGKFLVFKDTPLSRAIEDLESMYDVDVSVVGAPATEPTLTMWLNERSLQDALMMICTVIDARCSVEGTDVTIEFR